ncbi:unnamed protein product, partial [Mesorhabditis spiculigera]
MYSKVMIRQIHAGVSSIGLALNLLAIFLILKNKHSVVGRYAYLLFCFSIINLVYVLVDLLFAPPELNPELWVGYLGTVLVIGMLASIWMVIIYSGYNVYKALSTARIVSKKTKSLQQELFRALVIQLLIPLFFNYLPMSLIFASAIFRISVDLELTGLLFMLDPFIEPIVIIYFIKCYRTSFYRIFCCRGVTGSQVYSSQNARLSQQIKANSTSAAGDVEPTERPSGAKPEIFVSIPE